MRGVGSHLGLAVRPVLLDEGVGLRPAQPEREPEAERVAAVRPLPRGGAHPLEGLGPHAGHAQQLLLALLAQQHVEGALAKLLHERGRQLGSDALDRAATEELLHALRSARRRPRLQAAGRFHLQLRAELVMLGPPAHDGQALARLHEGQAVVGRDHDGLPTLRAAVERGHGVARVRPKEHAAYRAVEARRLAHSDHRGRTVSLTHRNVLHRRLPYSLHGEPGERAARVTQNERARRGGGEHGDHDGRLVRVASDRGSVPVFAAAITRQWPG